MPLSAMRKTIARRLQQSMQTAPHFYVTRLHRHDASWPSCAPRSTSTPRRCQSRSRSAINDLIVKAVALALARMPQVNVSFDGERLLFKKHINVGVAVALEQGLIVPVIRDADKRGVLDLARESRRLADAARTGKLKPEEFQGGTFTVSNLGMFDVESSRRSSIRRSRRSWPSARLCPRRWCADGQVVVRDLMKVTLSVDHRALDGAIAARFLQELKRLLE